MTTGDVVYRFSLIKILPEPGFDFGSTAGESSVLTARLHMLYQNVFLVMGPILFFEACLTINADYLTLYHSIYYDLCCDPYKDLLILSNNF